MSQPIAIDQGIAFAFPDVCNTPAPPSAPIPIPYPNIAMLSDANPKTDESGKELLIGPNGNYALLPQLTPAQVTKQGPTVASPAAQPGGNAKLQRPAQPCFTDQKGKDLPALWTRPAKMTGMQWGTC